MLPIVQRSVNLLLCLNNMLLSTITGQDWHWQSKIFSINSDYHLSLPIFTINLDNESNIDKFQRPDVYLMNLDEIDLENFFIRFYEYPFFNPRAKYILFGSTISENDSVLLTSNFIVNVVFLNTASLKIFTMFPYEKRMIWKTVQQWKEITSCDYVNSKGNINLFENKIPEIWTDSSVTVGYSTYAPLEICVDCDKRGYDIELLDAVLSHINVTGVFKQLDYPGPEFLEFGKHEILEKSCDIFLNEDSQPDLDFIYPYIQLALFWIVPAPQELPRWKYIFHILSNNVWIYWSGTLCILLVVWIIIDIILLGTVNIHRRCWDLIKLSIEQSISVEPAPTTNILMIIMSIFFTFMMSSIFKAGFPFLLSGINYVPPIENIHDMMDHNLSIGSPFYEVMVTYFSDSPDTMDYFNKHLTSCDFTDTCIHRLVNQKDLATIMIGVELAYKEKNYRDELGRSLIKKLKLPVMITQVSSIMLKGNPLAKSLNRYFLYFDQHGIKQRIESFYVESVPYQISFQIKPLSLKVTVFPFIILGLVYVVASIIFCIEYSILFLRREY